MEQWKNSPNTGKRSAPFEGKFMHEKLTASRSASKQKTRKEAPKVAASSISPSSCIIIAIDPPRHKPFAVRVALSDTHNNAQFCNRPSLDLLPSFFSFWGVSGCVANCQESLLFSFFFPPSFSLIVPSPFESALSSVFSSRSGERSRRK